jgi:hypothetical protein
MVREPGAGGDVTAFVGAAPAVLAALPVPAAWACGGDGFDTTTLESARGAGTGTEIAGRVACSVESTAVTTWPAATAPEPEHAEQVSSTRARNGTPNRIIRMPKLNA